VLADEADAITMTRYRALDLRVEMKADLTAVTDADRGTEAALRERIKRERSGDAVAGEEFGIEEGPARWWLDPIDGTAQYVRGIPIWATLIALEREGEAAVAVVSAPALGHRWWATKGGGAFVDGASIRVSNVARLEDAYVSATSLRTWAPYVHLGGRFALARTYPDFWQHMLVAEGRIEVAVDATLNRWDWLAPRLIVEEAGGRWYESEGLHVATNAALHDEVLAALRGDA
jgi:histidinol-phosphatase